MDFTKRTFSVVDYALFAFMLAISTAIGFFYAVKDRKRQNTEEYLLGGRALSPYPVALSLSVTFMSAILVLGTPSDVYIYGTAFFWISISFIVTSVVTSEIYIPVFYNMGYVSVYEYLQHRFNRVVRLAGTIVYMTHTLMYIGVTVYAPALALNAVTGFNIWNAVVATGCICILYSSLGGLKAVIWTDVIQMITMLIGFFSVIIQGSLKSGGFETVWRRCEEGGRVTFFNFDLDPRISYTFWTTSVGGSFIGLGLYAVNQGQVQRYLSCRSVKDAKKAVMINCFSLTLLVALAVLSGMVVYGYYHGCDPIKYGALDQRDQLLPFMVLDIFQNNPGMPGLILASIYSGSLSSVSTAITSLASVTIADFLKPCFRLKDATYTWIARGLVVFYGGVVMLFAYLTSQIGALLQVSTSIHGLITGPLLGLFTLGILFPFTNSIGGLFGLASGIGFSLWIFIAGVEYRPYASQFSGAMPTTIDMCPFSINTATNQTTAANTMNNTMAVVSDSTVANIPSLHDDVPPVADLFAVSFWYFSVLGFVCTLLSGILVSLITCGHRNCKNVDPKLIHPFFSHWFFKCLPDGFKTFMLCGVVHERKGKQGDKNDSLISVHSSVDKTTDDDSVIATPQIQG